jgi:hypothetical protein
MADVPNEASVDSTPYCVNLIFFFRFFKDFSIRGEFVITVTERFLFKTAVEITFLNHVIL